MTAFVRRMGSLVRGESSYSNEPDPWDNDDPLSFQSVRRESRAKPPPSLRVPRAITLPNLLSLRGHVRNRISSDGDFVPVSPTMSPAATMSPRSVASTHERVVDDHSPMGDISPTNMSRSFILPGKKTPVLVPTPTSRSFIWKNKRAKNRNRSDEEMGDEGKNGAKEGGQASGGDLEDIAPVSPVSEDTENEEERSSRRNWLRCKVRRVLRLRGRERA